MTVATSPYTGLDDADWTTLWAIASTLHAASPVLANPANTVEIAELKGAFESLIRLTPLGSVSTDVMGGARDRALEVCQCLAVGTATQTRRKCLRSLRSQCEGIPLNANVFERMLADIEERVSWLIETADKAPIHLELAKLANPERLRRRPAFQLTGRTRKGNAGEPVVELSISLSQIATETVLVLPYVIGHELFCHAFAGHVEQDLLSPFSEGLADYIIRWFVARWLEQTKSVPKGAASAARQHIEDFAADERRVRSERRLGTAAAENLRSHFRASDTPEVADLLLAQVVVAVNSATESLASKDRLTVRLAQLGTSTDTGLVQALGAWYETRDPRVLLL